MEKKKSINDCGYSKLLLNYTIDDGYDTEVEKAFNGRWVVEEVVDSYGNTVGIALTQKKQILYHWVNENSGYGGYTVFRDFAALKAEKVNVNILSAVAAELGEVYVEFLDI